MSTRTDRAERYREWLALHGVRFDFDAELARYALRTKAGVQNDIPPVEHWHRILPTLELAEALREQFGPTTVNSAHRAPDYNRVIGGATKSQHVANTALDLKCAKGLSREWAAFLRARRDAGAFKGGIGTYRTFVHVDTRGTNADWTG